MAVWRKSTISANAPVWKEVRDCLPKASQGIMHRAFCRIAAASFSPAHTFPAVPDSTTYPHVLIDRQTISRHVGWIVVVVLATTAAIVWHAPHAPSTGRLPGGPR